MLPLTSIRPNAALIKRSRPIASVGVNGTEGQVSILARLLDIVLPDGGYVVQLVEAYFDESGSHEGSPVLCVAGYIIEKDACIRLDEQWADVLQRFDLPYFRMSACAHGTEPFNNLTRDQRIEAEKECIAIIRDSITYGIAVSVEPRLFQSIMPRTAEVGSAYSYLAHTCLAAVKSWALENKYSNGISYFFESGHESQGEANALMNRIFSNPQLKAEHRYISHTFADKEKVKALQAADLIAWQWHTDHKRRMFRPMSEPRKDCWELMHGYRFHILHHDARLLKQMRDRVLGNMYPQTFVAGM